MPNLPYKPLTAEQIARRAGGRRRYNKQRQQDVVWRLLELESILRREGYVPGDYARWAARLGVSRSTICRDVQRLWNAGGSAIVAGAQMYQARSAAQQAQRDR